MALASAQPLSKATRVLLTQELIAATSMAAAQTVEKNWVISTRSAFLLRSQVRRTVQLATRDSSTAITTLSATETRLRQDKTGSSRSRWVQRPRVSARIEITMGLAPLLKTAIA